MVRFPHQKSAKQANAPNGSRGAKVLKQRKNHKVVVEKETQDKDKSRAVLSFRAEPPPGYTFIPAGNPQLTSALKEFARKNNRQILAVTTTPHASRHELSREVHRIGFHFPTEVVAQVCNHYGIRLTSGGKLVEEKDEDKLFMRIYQKGRLALDEKVRDQVDINTEAKQIIQDLFPNIPDNDLFQIIKTAFQLGEGRVGTADEIPLVRRAQLSVVAHIRHTYTNYDKLLRSVPYSEARHKVESITLQKLIDWRGDDQDDKHAMDDTLREVVVISDEEDSDDQVEEGQLIEHQDLRVQPVKTNLPSRHLDGPPQSPVEVVSDDDAPRGYRYLPQVVRRYPVQDPFTTSVARQQSRYAVWDRVRQEYRTEVMPQASHVVERIPLDERPAPPPQTTYVEREPNHVYAPVVHRVVEPGARVVSQPTPPTFVRGADGKLYERVTTYAEQVPASAPPRRLHTPPPTDHVRQYADSRPASPRPYPLRLHRRTESFDNNDGSVIPSIEGSQNVYLSPASRMNHNEDVALITSTRNLRTYDPMPKPAPVIDLTDMVEEASKRRRIEITPPPSYPPRHPECVSNNYARDEMRTEPLYQYDEDSYRPRLQRPAQLQQHNMTHSSQNSLDRIEARPQPVVVYRQEIRDQDCASMPVNASRNMTFQSTGPPYPLQSPRRIEYAYDIRQPVAHSYDEPTRYDTRGYVVADAPEMHSRVLLEEIRPPNPVYYTEPATRQLRLESHNAGDQLSQSRYYVQSFPHARTQR